MARSDAGFTQEELAPKAGISLSTLQKYERGASEPNWKRLAAIADATGKPLSYFVAGLAA